MQKSIQISIPEPCNVPWNSMTFIDERERHCSSCDRVIVDFSKMTDAELVNYFRRENKICGRFASHQIGRNLLQENDSRAKISWKTVFLFSSLALVIPGLSQNSKSQNQTKQETGIIKKENALREIKLEGFVKDSATNIPLKRILITLRTGQDTINRFTDTSGYYSFTINCFSTDSAELEVDEPTYLIKTEKINLDSQTIRTDFQMISRRLVYSYLPINLNYETMVLGGAVIQSTVGKPNPIRSFFYRLFHPRRFKS